MSVKKVLLHIQTVEFGVAPSYQFSCITPINLYQLMIVLAIIAGPDHTVHCTVLSTRAFFTVSLCLKVLAISV